MRGMQHGGNAELSTALVERIAGLIAKHGGWLPFDRFMHEALYAPGLGYYAATPAPFGHMPGSGSDFVTAPELSPLFGRALAAQLRQVLRATDTDTVVEFGAGSGALAEQLLDALDALAAPGEPAVQYRIVDVSGALRAVQQQRLARFGTRVRWLDRLPERIDGVVVGNEVLDAMPVRLVRFDGQRWRERGVALGDGGADGHFVWRERADDSEDGDAALAPPVDAPFVPGTVTELQPQAQAFIRTLAGVLGRGAALFIDYGFPEAEYYHPQRIGGTLMCHRAHRADSDPLTDVGCKDITAHVDFTGIALAAQDAGLDVLGYTSQARFLVNCGLPALLEAAPLPEQVMAHKLITEHEMGELFKVIAFGRAAPGGPTLPPLIGFAAGDRTHRL